jgi:hypothetical protein
MAHQTTLAPAPSSAAVNCGKSARVAPCRPVRFPLSGHIAVAAVALAIAPASVRATEPAPDVGSPAALADMPGGARENVTRLLERTRRRHGEAAVVVQTKLLLQTLRSGSQRATGVRLEGLADQGGTSFLQFQLETGFVFDDLTRDAEARVHMLWVTVMEPTLDSIRSMELAADGLAVIMLVHHRPYRTGRELRETIEQVGVAEQVAFYVRREDLAGLGSDGAVRDLFARSRITVDDAERRLGTPPLDAPTTPGPE